MMAWAVCKTPLRQSQNEISGKNKAQNTHVFKSINQVEAKQTYFTLWLAAQPKQVMFCQICLSSGQVNKAVSSVLFYFRWVSNNPATQIYSCQPSKYNLYTSHLSFGQVTPAVSYHHYHILSDHYSTETSPANNMSSSATLGFQAPCSLSVVYICFALVSKIIRQHRHQHYLSWCGTYGKGKLMTQLIYFTETEWVWFYYI